MELPRRKSIRLKEYDYSQNGAYFVTICVADRSVLLWRNVGADIIRPNSTTIHSNQMPLSQYGKIVEIAISQISTHYENIFVDKYCIMPDHVHMIVFIAPDESGRMISAPTLSVIIGSMKRWVSKQIGFPIWQKSFHDHIIRDEQEYQKIWEYIDTNPLKWELDEYHVK